MSDWLEAQNSDAAITSLAAYDTLWADVQRLRTFQILFVVFVPTTLALVAPRFSELAVTASIFGFAAVLVDAIFAEPFIASIRERAARTQDRFDSMALGLERPPSRRDADIERTELRLLAGRQGRKRAARNRDWYSPVLGRLPPTAGRVACMQESAVWDAQLRRRWSTMVGIASAVVTASTLALGLYGASRTSQYLLEVVFPMAPAIVWAGREWRQQCDAADRIELVRAMLRKTWRGAVDRTFDDAELTLRALDVSTELLDYRRGTNPVPDFVYRYLRPAQHENTQSGAGDVVDEYIVAGAVDGS